MKSSKHHALRQCFPGQEDQDHPLYTLFTRAHHIARLQTNLRKRLPPALAEHCWVSSASGPELTVWTDSPTLAIALRCQASTLLEAACESITPPPFNTLSVRHHPSLVRLLPPKAPQKIRRSLSPQAQTLLKECAQTIQKAELAQALENFGKNHFDCS